jgi:hypothetical protein
VRHFKTTLDQEGLLWEQSICSLKIMVSAVGVRTQLHFFPVKSSNCWSFGGIFLCGIYVVAASFASSDDFITNTAEASAANLSKCNTHSDCFAIGTTCLSRAPAEIIDNMTHQPCLTCQASYNVGTAPRMCINGACSCSGDSVVFGVVPRVHLAQYDRSTCDYEGSDCGVDLKL